MARFAIFWAIFCILVTTSGSPNLVPIGISTTQIKYRSSLQRFWSSDIIYWYCHSVSHFQSPKWRLKVLPVPVLTAAFDLLTFSRKRASS